jgi:hypothetical protein
VLWVLSANATGRRFYEACGWRTDGSSRPIDFDGTDVEETRYRAGPVDGPALDGANR